MGEWINQLEALGAQTTETSPIYYLSEFAEEDCKFHDDNGQVAFRSSPKTIKFLSADASQSYLAAETSN